MGSRLNLARNVFFMLGERLAILSVIILFFAIFFLETPAPAFSEEEKVYTGYTKEGLTYDFYLNSSYSYSVSAIASVSINHVAQSELSYITFIDSADEGIWDTLAKCESGGNWSIVSPNGLYHGGLQFNLQAWESVGGVGLASDASREEQIERGKILQVNRGWGVWGLCAKKLGLS